MNMANVMDEVAAALSSVEDLRVFPYEPGAVQPPVAIVGWPAPIEFDTTMGRGSDRMTLPVWILVSLTNDRGARDLLSPYLDGEDTSSIKAALESGEYTALDSLRVQEATVDSYTVSGISYLGAVFQLDIFG